MSAENPNNRDIIMELMIFKWTGSDNVSPNSRGKFIDARKLVAVEKLIGKRFIGTEGPNPHEAAAPILEKTYRGIFEMYYAQMIAQTHLKDLYGKITYTWDQEKNRIKGDLSQVASEIQQRISSNPENGKIILNEFIRTLWGFQATDMMNYETFRNSFVSNKPEIALIFRKYEEKGEKITVLRSQKIRRR
jgi:hypothetical protein